MTTMQRLHVGLHVLTLLLLLLGAARAVSTGSPVAAVVPSALAWAGAYAAGHRLSARTTHVTGPGPVAPATRWWLGALVLGWVALVAGVSAEFSWLAYPLVLVLVAMLPATVAHPVAAAMTALVVGVQLRRGDGGAGAVLGPVVGVLVAIGTAATYRRIARESEERRLLVDRLVAAQDELLAVQDELAASQREAGVAAERARLARDIHDTLAQGFSSVVLLSRAGQADPARAAQHLAQIEATAVDNLDEARRVVHALTPASLDDQPLPAAIGRLLDRLGGQCGIRTSLVVDGDPRDVPTAVAVALLRVAQSALANVRLHSGASRVGVTITYAADEVTLDVLDDGRGFDPARPEPTDGRTGYGVRGMRERLAGLGGRLVVESTPGEGTAVVATVPLRGEPR